MESLHTIVGNVQQGQKRGKRLGFPTMNVSLNQQLPEGIYVSKITIRGNTYNGLTFIGEAKTFDETRYQAETYVFNFDQDVYGDSVTVLLLKKIRDNQKFESEEKLVAQMEIDKKQAMEFFKAY